MAQHTQHALEWESSPPSGPQWCQEHDIFLLQVASMAPHHHHHALPPHPSPQPYAAKRHSNLSLCSHCLLGPMPAGAHFKCSLLNQIAHTHFLPQMKTNCNREKIILLEQNGSTDPISTLCSHLSTNKLDDNLPLFTFSTPSSSHALTKVAFLNRCNQIWTKFRYPCSTSHSFCIGGTTELLTTGTAPDIVKTMGHWSSDSFLCYWRDLEVISPLHAHKVKHQTCSD